MILGVVNASQTLAVVAFIVMLALPVILLFTFVDLVHHFPEKIMPTMQEDKGSISFLSQYPEPVPEYALQLREIISKIFPDIIEQLDVPAKMIAYCYGQKYAELICTIIPSKKGLKLGFNRAVDLPDPDHLLEGTGKISRYVQIKSAQQIRSAAIKNLLKEGLKGYKKRVGKV